MVAAQFWESVEKCRVKAVENLSGLGGKVRESVEKCGKVWKKCGKVWESVGKCRVNAVEESGGRDGSDVENPGANECLYYVHSVPL